jgi:tetratricopeptide (TPR) repeat protein
MGLLDEAIKEFQDAVSLVQPNDPTRRFFHCANLIGHCFMQKSMPHLALKWFQRALETPGLGDEEKQGIWYELALAHEAEGDLENAGRYFEQVYAENIDFRDVSQRVKNITISR